MQTIGISPKVLIPALGQIIIGVIFLLIGLDVEGRTAIATGLGTLVAGFTAPPGRVVAPTPSDSGLSDEAKRAIAKA